MDTSLELEWGRKLTSESHCKKKGQSTHTHAHTQKRGTREEKYHYARTFLRTGNGLVAKRDIKSGTTVVEEFPYSFGPSLIPE